MGYKNWLALASAIYTLAIIYVSSSAMSGWWYDWLKIKMSEKTQ